MGEIEYMKTNSANSNQLSQLENLKVNSLNKEELVHILTEISQLDDISFIKNEMNKLKHIINNHKDDEENLLNVSSNKNSVLLKKDILIYHLDQILKSKTLKSLKRHINKLRECIEGIKTNKINDINLLKWKDYEDIITDSLWILDKRDNSGSHINWYWGNFVPQIPRQLMLRYTKKGDWVLDVFAGGGTTLIECRRLGRNGIGIEINPDVVKKSKELIENEPNKNNVISEIFVGDSRTIDIKSILDNYKIKQVQLLIMHPPYHDIIKFSKEERDLSNARNIKDFLKMLGEVIDNTTQFLEKGRYLALIIGDKYSNGEWVPLGFYCMQEILKRGYILKSIVVKNIEETRGKRNQKHLWRYRALANGFYVFKHEYIMLFKKK